MIRLKLSEIASMLNTSMQGTDVIIDTVSTDSRTITGAALFIALKGANFDGNRFLAEVANKGAIALICSEEPPASVTLPYILVADGRVALGQLAAALKQKLAPKTIAVTGSAGKTTVKEMLHAILTKAAAGVDSAKEQAAVLATAGNFNNDIGVPLTLLRLTEQHRYAVIELGANHHGEIAYTTALVKPDVALITNAAASHLEGFGDIYGVARAKAEIYSGLTEGGTAVVSLDSDYSQYWLKQVQGLPLVTFSLDNTEADFYASEVQLAASGCAYFNLHTPTGTYPIKLTVPGRHNVANALAAAAAAVAVGICPEQIQAGLAQMPSVKGRTNLLQLSPTLRVIDDTYNANVESVKAAIDLLASYSGFRGLLLGDMGELGTNARLYHEQIGEYAKKAGINLLFTVGVLSQSASDLFHGQSAHFSQRQAMLDQLLPVILAQQEVTLLVKGSRSAKMELVVQDLLERCQQETSPC
ncbi:UDP-N-acetylmuramoyl-tripeptide--D-alanyl-D-alanine ligase [Alishewanella longhuensis]|uniref:UDP-N-acetylmuramoyl-tripeptide--D-alanyl-D-alanine ligase n=1 Tax=Alishewanella longhuensis TaxID=1091037 RepID=A0ABQ3L280_9ALTE|nr:UDP-N-acetylmuramoyl-tripeptide--D-alanyl-D-alanine ligase [Alishewanella longhuensis]GHG72304.1 UDP-N-acetylmuramoyl-tripeptide--D-alanyl-D-alanine ligase [Alishewanella longhuensis]